MKRSEACRAPIRERVVGGEGRQVFCATEWHFSGFPERARTFRM